MGETIVVRFDGGLEQVQAGEVVETPSLYSALAEGRFNDPTDVVVRAQALAIASVNEQWGVFSRSRVQLLPHQLWVCRQVNREWPFRWLVADDVGLGKTIECGLVLMPLITSGRVRRLLILAPAKLVPQWQYRLKDMFDIQAPALRVRSGHAGRGVLGDRVHGGGLVPHPARRPARRPPPAARRRSVGPRDRGRSASPGNRTRETGPTLAYGSVVGSRGKRSGSNRCCSSPARPIAGRTSDSSA